MANHRFEVGQTIVVPWSGRARGGIPSGMYVVVRLMPSVGGEPRYHAKSATDGHEWALSESQMQPAAEPR
jgi:hypothetical protein